jgi:hypothetical protein
MSLGSGLPFCWLCKNFNQKEHYCNLHQLFIPLEKGYVICRDFLDVDNPDFDKDKWFIKFRESKLANKDAVFIYSDNSSYEEYIPFADLKHKDAGSA